MKRAAAALVFYAALLALDHFTFRSEETRWHHYERLDRALDHLLWLMKGNL